MVIRMESIVPKALIKSRPVREELLKEMIRQQLVIESMYKRTVTTWTNKPVFKKRIDRKPNRLLVEVSTDSDIYRFLDDGTRVRHAVMSGDFSPKSTKRIIGARSGSGGAVFVSKKIRQPGIKAREFTLEIRDRRLKFYPQQMTKALRKGIKRVK